MKEHRNFLIKHLVNNRTPYHLFHFTSTKVETIIRDTQSLRLTKFDRSNDNLEFSYGLNIIKECLGTFRDSDDAKAAFIEKFIPFFEEEIKAPQVFFYMVCFCLDSENSYLKKNYAKKDGGMLNFDFNNQDFSGLAGLLAPVIYSKRVFIRRIENGLMNYFNYMKENIETWIRDKTYDENMKNLILTLLRDLFSAAAFVKRARFNPEQEYRMIQWGTEHEKHYIYLKLRPRVLR